MGAISIIRKTTVPLVLNFTDSVTNAAINITGYTVFFTVKKNTSNTTSDTDAVISKTLTSFSDPVNGQARITLSATDTTLPTGSYTYDITYLDTSNNRFASLEDDFVVLPNVTQRLS